MDFEVVRDGILENLVAIGRSRGHPGGMTNSTSTTQRPSSFAAFLRRQGALWAQLTSPTPTRL